ncbi:hypothetical protein EYC84_011019 [Monilinia fructicola]|uniref:Uncharacterized protein n=1 Tax=Monilinia fructicola TaxID=38448 RepID=A0A5M9JCB1_MONFR|nr:hypothetical protein EYC84_011019 [Monilinia fructicola]
MKYFKWISIGRKEKTKDDAAIIDDLEDGGKLKRKHGRRNIKESAVEGRSSPTKNPYEDYLTPKRPKKQVPKAKGSLGIAYQAKDPKGANLDLSISPYCTIKTGAPKERMATLQSTGHTRDKVSRSSSNNSITIIVTSPTSDAHFQQEDWSNSSSSASSISRSSLSSTSSFDTTRLMPPSISPNIQKYPKSNEAPDVKKWLIGCMNRKADTLPRKLVYRMMELANIDDEGIVLPIDIESENKDKKKELDNTEALHHLRTSLHPQPPAEGKERKLGKRISGHLNNTAPTKRKPKAKTPIPFQLPPHPKGQSQAPTLAYGKTLPRACETGPPPNPPHLHPSPNPNAPLVNHPFSFPPYTHLHPRHRPRNPAHTARNKNGHPTSTKYVKRGICPPRRGSVISLCSIPENGVSVGFGVGEGGRR